MAISSDKFTETYTETLACMHAYALLLFEVYLVHGFILGIAVLVLCVVCIPYV